MGGDIIGEINFFDHTTDGRPPWTDAIPKYASLLTNYTLEPTQVTIRDLRGKENSVDLDINAFEIMKYDGDIHDVFDTNSETQQRYFEEIATIIKNRLNASRVIVFNHIIRFRGTPRTAEQTDANHKNPIFYPHIDNDPGAVRCKIEEVLGDEEAKKVMKNRVQIINVWRPLGPNPVVNNPLTICDYRSLDLDHDIHLVKVYNSQATVASYIISRNVQDAQKWYYLSDMRSNEMFVFKIFDSNRDVAQSGAHTAFTNKSISSIDFEQISIEVRCIVLYDE